MIKAILVKANAIKHFFSKTNWPSAFVAIVCAMIAFYWVSKGTVKPAQIRDMTGTITCYHEQEIVFSGDITSMTPINRNSIATYMSESEGAVEYCIIEYQAP